MKHFLSLFGVLFAVSALLAKPEWTFGAYTETSTATTKEAGNLMQVPGTRLTVTNNEGAWNHSKMGETEVLVDGKIPYKASGELMYSVGNNAAMRIDFPGVANVSRLRFYISTEISHPRSGISVLKIESISGGEATEVPDSSYLKDFSADLPQEIWYDLAAPKGETLARGAEALLITFGSMQNNGVLMCEVEVIGEMEVAHYTVTFVDHEGKILNTLTDVVGGSDVSAAAPVPPERDGYVFLGWSEDVSRIVADVTVSPVYVAVGVPIWTCEPWGADSLPDEINLFAQAGATVEAVRGKVSDAVASHDVLSVLTDGKFKDSTYVIGDNSSLTFILPYAQDVGDIEVYTKWNDGGRDGLEISVLEYRSDDMSAWKPLPLGDGFSFGLDNNQSASAYHVRVYSPDRRSPLAESVKQFRISIARSDNGGTGIVEVRASRFIRPLYAWCGASWDSSADVELPVGNNLMRKRGAELSLVTNVPHNSLFSCTNSLAVLTNGVLGCGLDGVIYPLGNSHEEKAMVECRFDGPRDVSGIRLYTYFASGARDGIAVQALHVQRAGEDFFRRVDTVAPWSYGVNDDSTSGALSASISAPDGEYMFSRIIALRIGFGDLDHDCSAFSEIEVFGRNFRRPMILTVR